MWGNDVSMFTGFLWIQSYRTASVRWDEKVAGCQEGGPVVPLFRRYDWIPRVSKSKLIMFMSQEWTGVVLSPSRVDVMCGAFPPFGTGTTT